jgi:tetratricopeptide (TPR) repeat protein
MLNQSIAEYKRALQITKQWPVAFAALGNIYGLSGDKKEAKNILDTLNLLSAQRFVTSYGVALIYAALNEKDQAFQWLSKAYDERSNWLVWLKSDPRWSIIRSDKRFADLVNKVGLPE